MFPVVSNRTLAGVVVLDASSIHTQPLSAVVSTPQPQTEAIRGAVPVVNPHCSVLTKLGSGGHGGCDDGVVRVGETVKGDDSTESIAEMSDSLNLENVQLIRGGRGMFPTWKKCSPAIEQVNVLKYS